MEILISAKNIFTPLPFVSQANALPRFVECGMAALGVTAINYLLSVEPTSWNWALMKPAFKKVAQRMLGPIGVAIAVLSFTTCMLGLGS